MVIPFCNHSTWGTEVEGSGVPGQTGLPRETLSPNPRDGDAAQQWSSYLACTSWILTLKQKRKKIELLEEESDVGWPEAGGR